MRGPLIRGKTFFKSRHFALRGRIFIHPFDCNTVGPVPVVSVYGSRTLTHSAAYVLEGGTHYTSSPSSKYEEVHTQNGDNDLRELSKTNVGDPKRSPTIDPLVGRSDANVCGTQILHFTLVILFK